MKTRLLAVQGPLQFVAGMIAMDWFGQSRPSPAEYASVLLMYDFLMPEANEPELVQVIEELAGGFGWKKIVFISGQQMAGLTRGNYAAGMRQLRAALGEQHFDEIFLAREFCGEGSALIGNSYARAQKLAYGDSLGLIGDARQFSPYSWERPLRSLLALGRRAARRVLFGGPRAFAFDAAVLSLPLDLSRGALRGVPMLVPPKGHVETHFHAIHDQLSGLQVYCRALIDGARDGTMHLYLLSNLSASGLMSEENEIALYVHIISNLSRPGDVVCLKFHPRSSLTVLHAVLAQIQTDYVVRVIDDARLARLPIELWAELIAESNVVAMFSTSALNIKYIYSKDVQLPLTDDMLRRFFYAEKVDYMRSVCSMISESIAALDHWDGQSVLWTKYGSGQVARQGA